MQLDAVAAGLRDELITDDLAKALGGLEDRLVREGLTVPEAVERLGKHLLRVARRMNTPQDVDASVTAVNAAIEALGPDFSGDRVASPATLLKGIRSSTGLATELPAQPMLPLTSSELLVNGAGEPGLGHFLIEELRCAHNVDLICAFVGWTGFEPLRSEFQSLLDRGGRLRVITSTYLGATSARALDEFVKLGAEVRVNYQGQKTKLHAKAWLFHRPNELDTALVGSSNLSEAALVSGLEWNVRLARSDAPGVFSRIRQTFESYWHAEGFEPYALEDRARLDAALLDAGGYAAKAMSKKAATAIADLEAQLTEAYQLIQLQPKRHQRQVLDTLALRRSEFNQHKHLVVAATGTGKTVIAALDYASLCLEGHPRPKLLFVAHRQLILEQARATFRKALRDPNFGELLTGGSPAPTHGHHVFAMVQTLHNRLPSLPATSFDVVYIDEAHHGAAKSWQDVIHHFDPTELVGLTATPERSDGSSIADLFGGAYTTELRLWEAVDDQLLAPFDYVGVDDGTDLRHVTWHQGAYAIGALSDLYTGDHARVTRIIETIHQWVETPAAMRALGFCVSIEHAKFMTEQFTSHGFLAEYLTGDHDDAHRDAVLHKLRAGQLQVVFSVDVLGEGVDVPDVDTLLLLRPTQSPVLFAQQLGRGLRLAPGKAKCLVLDFIGQHRREYRLAERFRALVNSSQGTLQEHVEAEFPFLPSGCTITLHQVARDRVLAALKATALKPGMTGLTNDLIMLKSPSLEHFLTHSGRSIRQFYGVDGRRVSWTKVRLAVEPNAVPLPPPHLAAEEDALLRRMSYLQHVADHRRTETWFDWATAAVPPDVMKMSPLERRLATQLMHLLTHRPRDLQSGLDLIWQLPAVRSELSELLTLTHENLDAETIVMPGLEEIPLLAHARYTRAEVMAALGIGTIDKPFVHQTGTLLDPATRIQLLFVTLNKDTKRFSSTIQYKDHALSSDLFHWESPNNWRQDSAAMLKCIGQGRNGSKHRLLFVRESSHGPIEATFRCFGQVDPAGSLEGERPVALTWKLRQPLPEIIFDSASLVAAG